MQPKGWKRHRIGDLISRVDAGVSVNGEDRPAASNELGVLKVSSVSSGTFIPLQNKAILADEVARARTSPKADRVIVSRSNTDALVGASAYVAHDHPKLFLSDKLWQLEPHRDGSVSMRWLAYWLSSGPVREVLASLGTGTSGSMKNISKDELLGLWLHVPSVNEQRTIAAIIQTWDEAITTTERLLANSRRQKGALMEQLLAGKRRLLGHASKRCTYRLVELFAERVESNRGDLPLLSITREEGVIPRDEVGRKDTSNEDKSKYLRVCPGDIAYNTMRMWQGVSALSRYEGIVSPAYTVVVPKKRIDAQFAAYLFKYSPVVFLFYRYSQGLVSDTWNLKFHHFSEIKVEIPGLKEQVAIAHVLKDADAGIAALEKELDRLHEEKRALMADLLTGKRRVRLSEAPVEPEVA